MFKDFLSCIDSANKCDFIDATIKVTAFIDHTNDFKDILEQIGIIPEYIAHDSTKEKLYSKASDAALARAFREIGLKATVITKRADTADVIAESPCYGYTMVADAKAFRMSRTAKNQKDFKVTALSGWRKDADYAVLCAPFFHYPRTQSQIYAQAVNHNVCLLSWEHLLFMINENIRETDSLNLSSVWNFGKIYSRKVAAADTKKCFLWFFTDFLFHTITTDIDVFNKFLARQKSLMQERGNNEKVYWKNEKEYILSLTKQKAIEELLIAKKIDTKINQIDKFIEGLQYG